MSFLKAAVSTSNTKIFTHAVILWVIENNLAMKPIVHKKIYIIDNYLIFLLIFISSFKEYEQNWEPPLFQNRRTLLYKYMQIHFLA